MINNIFNTHPLLKGIMSKHSQKLQNTVWINTLFVGGELAEYRSWASV